VVRAVLHREEVHPPLGSVRPPLLDGAPRPRVQQPAGEDCVARAARDLVPAVPVGERVGVGRNVVAVEGGAQVRQVLDLVLIAAGGGRGGVSGGELTGRVNRVSGSGARPLTRTAGCRRPPGRGS
jgi:hypothetical protein